jgi:hypothetical protein
VPHTALFPHDFLGSEDDRFVKGELEAIVAHGADLNGWPSQASQPFDMVLLGPSFAVGDVDERRAPAHLDYEYAGEAFVELETAEVTRGELVGMPMVLIHALFCTGLMEAGGGARSKSYPRDV